MVKTAVVILNWNGLNFLKMFLGNIVGKTIDSDTLVYIADNGSSDGSCEWLSENHPEVRLIRFTENHGFAEGYNLAISQIEATYLVLMNSDIEVTDGWLTPLIRHLDDNPDTAACQPKILSWKERDRFEYAGAAGGFIDKLGYPFCRGRLFSRIERDEGQYDSQTDIFWSSGACMAVRSKAWKESGGFDPDFFAHMEEIDLCWRFHKMGYRIKFIPGSTVYHVGGGALPYNSPFKTYLNFRNSIYLLYKNLPDRNFTLRLFMRKILDGVAAILFLFRGDRGSFSAVWKAHRDAGQVRENLLRKREAIKSAGNSEPEGLILNKSIVFEFYIKRNKTYNSIIKTN